MIQLVDSGGMSHRVTVEMPAAAAIRQVRIALASPPRRVDLDPDVDMLATMTVVRQ